MRYVEYGKENDEVIVFLHGGGLSWWHYREAAERLSDEYHVILPILDGHAGADRDFTTIEDNAAEIIEWVDRSLGGRVRLMGGYSLGGQILLEILSQRGDICRYALIESALTRPSRLLAALIAPTVGCSYGLIRRRWFAALQFRSLRIKTELYEDYYRDSCAITKANMIAFMQANARYEGKESLQGCTAEAHIFVGEKESAAVHKSAEVIREKLRASVLHILPQMAHGEFSINRAGDYAKTIAALCEE
ncbi:MAG: alpha/beta hydrolase [Oscillospiraceae bacterium]|nr:alpha/beta hydrolase [Oscillospiraceae bacterium]